MNKITVKSIGNSNWESEANQLVNSTYNAVYGIQYNKLDQLLERESQKVSIGTIQDCKLTSTLTIYENQKDFPSNQFFNFELPKFLKNGQSIEIGRLTKDFNAKKNTYVKHIETISLLQGLMAYSKKAGIEYWQATLHPHLVHLLKNELEVPFNILYKGKPIFSNANKHFEQYMGNYLQDGIYYVWSDMPSSFKALEKWNLNEFVNFEI